MDDQSLFLVIGYGNTLRGDDGLGPKVAEAIQAMNLPGVGVLTCQQLSPEDADPISNTAGVVFVDAAVGVSSDIQLRKIEPGNTLQLMAHAADPRTMLALARDVFGHCPEAWCLTIPAIKLDFSEEFSPKGEEGFQKALGLVQSLAREFLRNHDKKGKLSGNIG